MIIFDILIYGHGVSFVLLHLILFIGIFIERRRDKKISLQAKGKVSLLIPIHNESKRMENLLRSLLNQTYPAQIIFIDDRSTDESPAMLAQFAKDAATRGIDCRIITLSENPGANRKQFAISKGIALADGDYFLFTDGDCEVPQGWINYMVSRINNEKTGAVIAPVFKKKGKGFFSVFQCYDHIIRYFYLASSAAIGNAGGGFGNNLIVSRKALEKAGGYDAIPVSSTEDASLISQIRRVGKYKIRAVIFQDGSVETEPETSWKNLINQTLRWNNGGLFSPEISTRVNFTFLMLTISAGITAIVLLPFFHRLWPMAAGYTVAMIMTNIAIVYNFKKHLSISSIFAMLLVPFYYTLLTIMGYLRIKPTWKK